jgi:hypothetical protein
VDVLFDVARDGINRGQVAFEAVRGGAFRCSSLTSSPPAYRCCTSAPGPLLSRPGPRRIPGNTHVDWLAANGSKYWIAGPIIISSAFHALPSVERWLRTSRHAASSAMASASKSGIQTSTLAAAAACEPLPFHARITRCKRSIQDNTNNSSNTHDNPSRCTKETPSRNTTDTPKRTCWRVGGAPRL